jgi:UDP-glucose 4-epimerase
MNFAGLKSVAESIVRPLSYYSNNVSGLVTLLKAMDAAEIRTLIFSSSATVYGDPATIPIPEDTPRVPLSPYARSKIAAEDVLLDLYNSDSRWKIAQLRYFNPVGAHESGFIGENPIGIATNLMPSILSVATGETPRIFVFGGDYPTPDGTCIRDYIHVMDLVEGHIAALSHLENNGGLLTCNLGTGEGVSVLQLITAFEQANSCVVPYKVTARRQGDIVQSWANPDRALKLLGWKTQRDLFSMCRDAWRWHKRDLHK